MKLNLNADWTQPSPDIDRLEIGNYNGTVERVVVQDQHGNFAAYQYMVLRGFDIVESGVRLDRHTALGRVELVIRKDAEAVG
jgi:hypothetical protein